jgi:hypothetical protein
LIGPENCSTASADTTVQTCRSSNKSYYR